MIRKFVYVALFLSSCYNGRMLYNEQYLVLSSDDTCSIVVFYMDWNGNLIERLFLDRVYRIFEYRGWIYVSSSELNEKMRDYRVYEMPSYAVSWDYEKLTCQ